MTPVHVMRMIPFSIECPAIRIVDMVSLLLPCTSVIVAAWICVPFPSHTIALAEAVQLSSATPLSEMFTDCGGIMTSVDRHNIMILLHNVKQLLTGSLRN